MTSLIPAGIFVIVAILACGATFMGKKLGDRSVRLLRARHYAIFWALHDFFPEVQFADVYPCIYEYAGQTAGLPSLKVVITGKRVTLAPLTKAMADRLREETGELSTFRRKLGVTASIEQSELSAI